MRACQIPSHSSHAGSFVVLALLANYSGFLFCRLFRATPGAVLFGDIGFKAAGSFGRNIVYATIYSLDATQCVILHLAATQSLRHIFPGDAMPSIWQAGAVVVVIACILVQVRSLAELSWLFAAGTLCQLGTFGIVMYELISNPDPDAKHSSQAVIDPECAVPATVAIMSMIFAFGGQFAFVEIMSSMKRWGSDVLPLVAERGKGYRSTGTGINAMARQLLFFAQAIRVPKSCYSVHNSDGGLVLDHRRCRVRA